MRKMTNNKEEEEGSLIKDLKRHAQQKLFVAAT